MEISWRKRGISMIFLPLFFMYIFPLFFLGIPPIRTSPIFATVLLFLGFLLWMIQTYMISDFITRPVKLARNHEKVQVTGKSVQAEILDYQDEGMAQGYPSKKLLVSFPNLVGNKVKTYISVLDSKEHEKRFELGKKVNLKLNQSGFEPPFTIEGAEYEIESRPWAWGWIIFNLLYMIGFFLLSYYLQSDGYGWRFLNPFSPWIWAPIIGIIILRTIMKIFGSQDIIDEHHELTSLKSDNSFGELLLYGKTSEGEILNFSQTGTYINEQPQIRFTLRFYDELGNIENKSFKKVVSLTELHKLKKGEVEVLYLPRNTDIFMVDFLNKK